MTRLAEAAIEEREVRIKGHQGGSRGTQTQHGRETHMEAVEMGGLGQLTIKALQHLCAACCVTRLVKKAGR